MIPTAIIAFREFFEAFLIVGVFLGISKKLGLKKEWEIAIAAGIGIILSLLLATIVFIFGDGARAILTEKNTELFEGGLLVFSGVFLAYVIFSLHKVLGQSRTVALLKAKEEFHLRAFDVTLFFTIMFLVVREGFEIALFSASVSLFATFLQNFIGLIIGLASASLLGISTFFAYSRLPIGKVFRVTEYLIVLLGAALTQNGITKLFESQLGIHLSNIGALPLQFLPDSHSVVGHLIKSFFGVDQEFSLARLAIMVVYIGIIYVIFLRHKNDPTLPVQKASVRQ